MINYDRSALEYIAKIADGGMRDAITLMDKCLSYSEDLTMENVIKALGVADYSLMFDFTENLLSEDPKLSIINTINDIYSSGIDLKLFIKTYFEFILDMNIYKVTENINDTKIPVTYLDRVKEYGSTGFYLCERLLPFLVKLQSDIKWEQNPKAVIIANFLIFVEE